MTKLLERRRERTGYYQLFYRLLSDEAESKELREQMAGPGSSLLRELRGPIVLGHSSGEIAKYNPDQLLEVIMALIEVL